MGYVLHCFSFLLKKIFLVKTNKQFTNSMCCVSRSSATSTKGLCEGGCLDSAHALQHSHDTRETVLFPADDTRWTCGHAHLRLCRACYDCPTCPVDGHAYPRTSVRFRLLTWNVDGLDERNPVDRITAVCNFVKAKLPHAVFLQEVIPATWQVIVRKLEDSYDCYSPPTPVMPYYAALLVSKTLKTRGEMDCFDFPTSCMGRHLIHLPITFAGAHIDLFTSHLESTKDKANERVCQLKLAFDRVSKTCSEDSDTSCIFAGDMNLRDSEVTKAGVPQGMRDVWEAHGSPAGKKFTWDVRKNDNLDWPHPYKPSCRFDRVYLMNGQHGSLKIPVPSSPVATTDDNFFELVGKIRLRSCGNRFPSDHWGIWAEFLVDYPEKISLTNPSKKLKTQI